MQEWINDELQTSDCGDERLDVRYARVLDELSQRPSESINSACSGWAEALGAYRFFDNERVDYETVLRPHQDATLQRIDDHDVVLLVQDTTEIDVTRPERKMTGAGPLNDESQWGFLDHAMLALTPEKIPLGVVDANIWARDLDEFREYQKEKARDPQARKKKKQRPIEEKESYRWLQGYWQGCEIAEQVPDTTIVVISDSDADIFECFADTLQDDNKAEWVIRACQDRTVLNKRGTPSNKKLWEKVVSTPVLGTMEIDVSRNRPKQERKRNQRRSRRTATLTIRATRVEFRGVQRTGGRLADIEVNAILIREKNPPKDEEPIEWLLLTSLPIETFEQVCTVIDYYTCRWQIEVYFRVLKSGCKVENRQFEDADRYLPCLALYMVVAWRVMYVIMLGREYPDMSCAELFSEDEWKAVYMVSQQEYPPEEPPSLEEFIYMVAGLGGHLGRTHDGPPGPKTMWVGMQRMMDLALAWRTFGPAKPPPKKRKKRV